MQQHAMVAVEDIAAALRDCPGDRIHDPSPVGTGEREDELSGVRAVA